MLRDPYNLTGKMLGSFQVFECVGEGGMAVVYRALQTDVGNREVALKIARPEMSAEGLARFDLEAANAGRLHHDHIVPIYAAGEALGFHYIAMRFVPGSQNLDDVLRGRAGAPMSIDDAMLVLEQVAAALDYSHSQGIVHRDINPRNIMLETAPRYHVYVVDFGISVAQETQLDLTRPDMRVGTAQYMAPEQHSPSRFGPVGPAADRWALAVVAYQMLTGRRPFEGESTLDIAIRVMQATPARPSSLSPLLPPRVDRVLRDWGLAKAPASRPASCTEFCLELRRVFKEKPKPRPSPRLLRVALAVVLVGILALTAVTIREYVQDGRKPGVVSIQAVRTPKRPGPTERETTPPVPLPPGAASAPTGPGPIEPIPVPPKQPTVVPPPTDNGKSLESSVRPPRREGKDGKGGTGKRNGKGNGTGGSQSGKGPTIPGGGAGGGRQEQQERGPDIAPEHEER